MVRTAVVAATPSATERAAFRAIGRWFDANARDLPWRHPAAGAWAVMVSEFMLQQTPVNRVLPVYNAWMDRWPTATAMADATVGDAIRAWGRLGYPRRAQRLHAAAQAIRDNHNGEVPRDLDALRALPGVGEYTSAAIAAFAFGQRVAVLDTNVRRVHARMIDGVAYPNGTAPSRPEVARALAVLPRRTVDAAHVSAAVMELGALVCTARTPDCAACPVASRCRWRLDGQPAWDGPERRGQSYDGTDRQCRGALLAVLRDSADGVVADDLLTAWPRDREQARRALDSLQADGLVEAIAGTIRLPT